MDINRVDGKSVARIRVTCRSITYTDQFAWMAAFLGGIYLHIPSK